MRLLLIEDDMKIASFILRGMNEAGFAIDHAKDGEDGLHMALTEPYDTIIIDLMLPKLDGLKIIEIMREQNIITPVIILSAKRALDDRIKGLQTGSDDYLTKPFAFTELLVRVQALIRRAGRVAEPSRLSVADLSMDMISHEVSRGGIPISLQPKEYTLLEFMMRNRGKVLSKTTIMEHVWDYNFDPKTNVVEARMCRLREKVDKGFDKKLIHTVFGVGYVLKESN